MSGIGSAFGNWFARNASRLESLPSAAVATEIGDHLLSLDSRLGVEVSEGHDRPREVVVTAFSDPALFPVVHEIVGAVGFHEAWRFCALKPARGFAFSIALGSTRIDAKDLRFAALLDVDRGIAIGFEADAASTLRGLPDAGREVAWLIVEAGIGELLTGLLEEVEVADAERMSGAAHPIAELAVHVRRLARV